MICQQMNVLSFCQGVLNIAKEFCRPKEIENTTSNLKTDIIRLLNAILSCCRFYGRKTFSRNFLMLLRPKMVVKFSLGKFLL